MDWDGSAVTNDADRNTFSTMSHKTFYFEKSLHEYVYSGAGYLTPRTLAFSLVLFCLFYDLAFSKNFLSIAYDIMLAIDVYRKSVAIDEK